MAVPHLGRRLVHLVGGIQAIVTHFPERFDDKIQQNPAVALFLMVFLDVDQCNIRDQGLQILQPEVPDGLSVHFHKKAFVL